MRARGLGANVIVTEVVPTKALEAAMDGFRVMPIAEAARLSDFVVTATGDKHVVDTPAFKLMKDGCVLANSGHFNVEINIPALANMATSIHQVRPHVDQYLLGDHRHIYVLAKGRLVNLAAAEGHPATVMDMSFANQALALTYLVEHRGQLSNAVHSVDESIDAQVAELKLQAMGLRIDTLTNEQRHYLASWQEGT